MFLVILFITSIFYFIQAIRKSSIVGKGYLDILDDKVKTKNKIEELANKIQENIPSFNVNTFSKVIFAITWIIDMLFHSLIVLILYKLMMG